MSQFAISACRQFWRKQGCRLPGNQQATRFYVDRVVIATTRIYADASAATGLLQRLIPTAIGIRFRRH
jgi:hypothetical protein